MKIPKTTQKPRFYVATSMDHAYSSWNTVEEAVATWGRLRDEAERDPKHYKADFEAVIGIVRVDQKGRKLIRDKAFYGPPDPDSERAGTTPASPPSGGGLSKTVHFTTDSAHPYCDWTRTMGKDEPSSVSWGDVTCRGCLQCRPPAPRPDNPGCKGGLSGCTWEGQHRRDCHRVGLDLGVIRDAAGKRSSSMQHAIVDATGEIYRLCDQVERLTIERDQARDLAEGLRIELNAAWIVAQEAIAAWKDSVANPVAMQRALDRLAQVKRR